jgi:hypothetical protein
MVGDERSSVRIRMNTKDKQAVKIACMRGREEEESFACGRKCLHV